MNILVTGDTGFIGRNLEHYLAEKGCDMTGYSRSRGNDMLDKNHQKLYDLTKDVDVVYHLAAYAKPGESIVNPRLAIETNIIGTLNFLEAARHNDFALIYPSSCEIYGDSKAIITEADELNPPNPYAAAKAACDRLCYAYYKTYGLQVAILRLFNPYGPYQQLNKIIPTFYFQAREGKPITVYGKGEDTRDYTHVDDIVTALYMALRLPKGEVVNICTSRATSNYEVAVLVKKLTKSLSPIVFVDYPETFGGIKNQCGSYQQAKELIGWEPKVTFEEGLERTIQWCRTVEKDETN